MIVNDPETKASVEREFAAYENALVTNDVGALDNFFWNDPLAIRYGGGENLYGFEAVAAFRASRPSVGLMRSLESTVITTFGKDVATACTLFRRDSAPNSIGRQTQTWVLTTCGWKIVAAHVSMIPV